MARHKCHSSNVRALRNVQSQMSLAIMSQSAPHNCLTGSFSQQWHSHGKSHACLSCVTSGSCDKTILERMWRNVLQEEDLVEVDFYQKHNSELETFLPEQNIKPVE